MQYAVKSINYSAREFKVMNGVQNVLCLLLIVKPINAIRNTRIAGYFTLKRCRMTQENLSVHWWLNDLGSHCR
jgi:hypothetical protein